MNIQEIKDLRAKITPGEWKKELWGIVGWPYSVRINDDYPLYYREYDADFISQAPAMIDFLLSEVERLEKEKRNLELTIQAID